MNQWIPLDKFGYHWAFCDKKAADFLYKNLRPLSDVSPLQAVDTIIYWIDCDASRDHAENELCRTAAILLKERRGY